MNQSLRAAGSFALLAALLWAGAARARAEAGEVPAPTPAPQAWAEPAGDGAEPRAYAAPTPAQAWAEPEITPLPDGLTAAAPYETMPPGPDAQTARLAVVVPAEGEETAPLYGRVGGEVLMEYYQGARVTALAPAGGGLWRVQAGEKGAALTGYMRGDNLRFGAAAQREVRPVYLRLRFNREATVYGWIDEGATALGTCTPDHTYYAVSRSDAGWVQLFLPPVPHAAEEENRIAAGFVRLEPGTAIGYWNENHAWAVDPLPGELTQRGALRWAAHAAAGWYARLREDEAGSDPDARQIAASFLRDLDSYGWDEDAFGEEALLATPHSAALAIDETGALHWEVFFYWNIDDCALLARVWEQGGESVSMIFGTDYDAYALVFQL